MNEIRFFSADKEIAIKNRKACKALVRKIFINEGRNLNMLSFIFCSDNYLLEINKQFLLHNYFTDVITFLFSPAKTPIIAEVYLSVDRIKENAKTYSCTYQTELLRVIIHGALHLCGFDDKTKAQNIEMRKKEDFYIHQYEISRET